MIVRRSQRVDVTGHRTVITAIMTDAQVYDTRTRAVRTLRLGGLVRSSSEHPARFPFSFKFDIEME